MGSTRVSKLTETRTFERLWKGLGSFRTRVVSLGRNRWMAASTKFTQGSSERERDAHEHVSVLNATCQPPDGIEGPPCDESFIALCTVRLEYRNKYGCGYSGKPSGGIVEVLGR